MAELSHVPLPPPGVVSLSFSVAGQRVLVSPPRHRDVPVVDAPLRNLLLLLRPRELLTALSCLLSEQRIVVASSSVALLTPVAEALLAILAPLRWQHLYIPVLPAAMSSYVEVPWPYVIGVHTRMLAGVRAVSVGVGVGVGGWVWRLGLGFDDTCGGSGCWHGCVKRV